MRIKEVEDQVGITKKNIRFYEKEGLLSPERERENSYRDYSPADVERLKQIKLLRKLQVPISDIRSLFADEAALPQVIQKHTEALEREKRSLAMAQQICAEMLSGPGSVRELDINSLLAEIEQLERGGAVFMNVRKEDVRRKYVGPITACTVIVAIGLLLLTGFLYVNYLEPAPKGIFWVFVILLLVLPVGTIIALVSRIKEIRGGEENDLGQY